MIARRMIRDRTGSTAVEFALVGAMLCLMTFAIIETGLLWWAKSGMQVTAALTARCGAIGMTYSNSNNLANFACANSSATQNYAVSTVAASWLFPNMITTNSVTLNGTSGKVTSCNGFTGNFFSVTIASNYFANIPPPLSGYTSLSVNACYPMQ